MTRVTLVTQLTLCKVNLTLIMGKSKLININIFEIKKLLENSLQYYSKLMNRHIILVNINLNASSMIQNLMVDYPALY